MSGRTALRFQLGRVPLYQPQVFRDFPAANKNLTLLLCCCTKGKANASISQRCPDLEGEGARALWKERREVEKGRKKRTPRELGFGVMENILPEETDDVVFKALYHCRTFISQLWSGDQNLICLKTPYHLFQQNSLDFLFHSETLLEKKKKSAVWNTVVTWGQGQRFGPWLDWSAYAQKTVQKPHSNPTTWLIIGARRQSMLISVKLLSQLKTSPKLLS